VDEYLTDADHKQSAMQLLATVVHRQGPHLHEIADTPLLTTLLRIPLVRVGRPLHSRIGLRTVLSHTVRRRRVGEW
jgi:hypothetical protein